MAVKNFHSRQNEIEELSTENEELRGKLVDLRAFLVSTLAELREKVTELQDMRDLIDETLGESGEDEDHAPF
jgi:predicted  nucleic acid-binding Zn-ribbon protein